MANIHIARNNESLGSFGEEAVRDGILTGRFTTGDLAWREGMNEWRPLGEMAPQWEMEIPASPLAAQPAPPLPAGIVEEGSGPAWEERQKSGLFPAIFRTSQAVLMQPTTTFAAMKQTGGLANPLLYFVLLSSSMFAVSAMYQIAATSMNPAFAPQLQHLSSKAFSVALIGSVLISPALYVVSAFISSGITHLTLMLLGGAHRPFETTFRVICYAQGSAALFNLLPLFGSLIGLLMSAYCIIIGLKEAHGTEGWRATLALILPGILCCGILLVLGTAAGFGIAGILKAGH